MSIRLVLHASLSCFLVILFVLHGSIGQAQTWTEQESGTFRHFSCVQFVTEQIGWVSGTEGAILKTTNGGATWVSQTTGHPGSFSDHYFVDANTGWAVGQGGVIKKTADGGATWNTQNSGTISWLNFVNFVSSQTGYAAGVGGTVLKTTNGGTNWVLQPTGSTKTIEGGFFTSATDGYLCGEDGSIWKTTNGGTSWTLQSIVPPNHLNGMWFASASTGWTVGENGRALKSTNSGASWFDQTVGTSQSLNEVSFSTVDTGWAVGNGGVIYATVNGGTTWQAQFSFTTQNLRSVFIRDPRHGWAVGLNNTILEYATVHQVPIQLASFSATVSNDHDVRLNWKTMSEINNYGFEVQRAYSSPENFETLSGSFIPGHGTTNQPQNYTWTDNAVPAGHLYYRLKQMDLDGTINYTEPVSVDVLTGVEEAMVPATFSLKQNYPNPFNPSTQIEFDVARSGLVSLKVYNLLGEEIATIVNEDLMPGKYIKTFTSAYLSSGVYLYKLTAAGFTETRKLTLVR